MSRTLKGSAEEPVQEGHPRPSGHREQLDAQLRADEIARQQAAAAQREALVASEPDRVEALAAPVIASAPSHVAAEERRRQDSSPAGEKVL